MIGVTKWKENRMIKPFSEYVSISDEAFLLLIYDSYNEKWLHNYKVENNVYNDTDDVKPDNVVRKKRRFQCLIQYLAEIGR